MKNLLIALVTLLASSTAFASESYTCKGINGSEGHTIYMKLLSGDQVREGDKMTFLLVVRKGSETLFASNSVSAKSEDVMLSFKGRKNGVKMSAMIYMDEPNESWVELDGETIHMDCSRAE